MRLERWVAGFGAAGVAAGVVAPVAAPLALAGVIGAVWMASARPELEAFGPAVSRARHPGRLALTIDDGPHPVSTPAMLAALAEARATATFFLLADRAERHPDLLRAIRDGGHEVGLHGLSHHPWLTVYAPARGAAELRRAVDMLGAPAPRWFRPPFGAVSPRLHQAVRLAGLTLAWCSVRTGDGVRIAADTLRARCRKAVGTDIVLLHDGDGPTWRLLPELLAEWDSRGIRPSTLTEAMA